MQLCVLFVSMTCALWMWVSIYEMSVERCVWMHMNAWENLVQSRHTKCSMKCLSEKKCVIYAFLCIAWWCYDLYVLKCLSFRLHELENVPNGKFHFSVSQRPKTCTFWKRRLNDANFAMLDAWFMCFVQNVMLQTWFLTRLYANARC